MTVFLSLRTQYENLGDEVINSLMILEFCRRGPVVGLGDGVPGWYLDNLRSNLGPLANRLTIVSRARDFSLGILKAGLTGPQALMFTSCGDVSSPRSNYRRDGYLQALQHLPFLNLGLVGASFAAISPSKAWLLRTAQRRGEAISVRDSRSQRLLAEGGITVPVTPDLAFLLPVAQDVAAPRDLALIMLREVPQTRFDALASSLAELAQRLRAQGLAPAVAWQVGRDAAFGRRLAVTAGLPEMTPTEQTAGRLEAAAALYRRTAVIYSNRLHGLLVAAANGAAPVALLAPQESKVRGIFEDAGWADLIAAPAGTGAPAAVPVPDAAAQAAVRKRVAATFAAAAERLQAYFDRTLGAPTRSAA